MQGLFVFINELISYKASGVKDKVRIIFTWLGIRDDYRTLIGLDSLGVVERDNDDVDVEKGDV